MDLGLNGKVFVITGGTRGLGLATAKELISEGAFVCITGRNQERLEGAVQHLGTRAIGIVADNSDDSTAERVIVHARETFGRFDGIFVNGGGPAPGDVLEAADADWVSGFNETFLGSIRFARVAAEHLTDGGFIGFILSGTALEPTRGLAISSGLRPGLAAFAKALSNEIGPLGIRVTCLLPHFIDTNRTKEIDRLSGDPKKSRSINCLNIPLRRYAEPVEFGRVAAFISSPAASYVHGSVVRVDGGAISAV